MPTEHRQLIDVMKTIVSEVPERYAEYHNDLWAATAQIVSFEREHKVNQMNIVQKIYDQCDSLAMLVDKNNRK